MIPYNETYAVQFGEGCNAVYVESGAPVDPGMISVHSTRAAWDYYSGTYAWPDSYAKHIDEFRAEYGLPPTTVKPPTTTPPSPSTPLDVINAVYATGAYNLATKPGCGGFTEECARQLAALWGGPPWGHVAKAPGQNQHQGHAVDAVMALYGSDHGIWDIIVSSVSTSARPAFNRAGDAKPELWRPPMPLPCQPAGAATRDVPVTVTISLEDFLRLREGRVAKHSK